MGELCSMRNIGKEMERKLNSVGIFTPDELTNTGSKKVFSKMKDIHPNVCLVHLYILQAAIDDVDMNQLSAETKSELKIYSDSIKAQS